MALFVASAFAQEAQQEENGNANDSVRRLRFRRPRPKVAAVSNEDGVAQGRPVPLRAAPAGKSINVSYLLMCNTNYCII